MLKKIRHLLEMSVFWLFYRLFKILPLDVASNVGGFIGRYLLYYLSVSEVARKNLNHAFPEKKQQEIEKIIRGIWDNLGRNVGEFPHVMNLSQKEFDKRVEVIGMEHLRAIIDDGKGGITFTSHSANWEVEPLLCKLHDYKTHIIYRKMNNPYVDRFILKQRNYDTLSFHAKGRKGSSAIIKALAKGETVAMLPDQKFNEGLAIDFFGRKAMTAPLIATLKRKYDYPIVPTHIIRTKGANFKIVIEPPMQMHNTKDAQKDIEKFLTAINAKIEEWVRENPEQWFWLHKRW
jgi:KDO2-lipid IV(A) lauroyltransferase